MHTHTRNEHHTQRPHPTHAQVGAINLAYTTEALGPHMDLCYYESPPGLQLLHCMRNDDGVVGGESLLIDAFSVAEGVANAEQFVGEDAIGRKLMQLGGTNVTFDQGAVDGQPSVDDGVLVMCTGMMARGAGQRPVPFAQSVFLEGMHKPVRGYYVRNDILRTLSQNLQHLGYLSFLQKLVGLRNFVIRNGLH